MGVKRSGIAAITLLLEKGARVRAMDTQPLSAADQAYFEALGVEVVKQEIQNLGNPELIVLSPAVPNDLPMLLEARGQGIPVIGEVELASHFLHGPVAGITGSNGKTTTTALTGHLLRECNIACQVGGNIGTAVTSMVASSDEGQWNVLELSSFQLETVFRFRATIGACLNVTPDHLDRHLTLEAYAAAKARLFETQRTGDVAILNYDDKFCQQFAKQTKAEVYWFSSAQPVPVGISLAGDVLLFNGKRFMDRSQIHLRGLHNVENVMAAALIARFAGAALDQLGAAIQSFPGVEHRLEFVRSLRGIDFYNDSKATNVDATLKAVDAFDGGLWVILGGKDKGGSYGPLRRPLAEKAKGVLLIGAEPPYPNAAAPLIEQELSGSVPLVRCGTLDRAVKYAVAHAAAEDTVLLAPACASFDQFESYEQRGNAFKQLVRDLI